MVCSILFLEVLVKMNKKIIIQEKQTENMDLEKIKVSWDDINSSHNSEHSKISVSDHDIPENKAINSSLTEIPRKYFISVIIAVIIGLVVLGIFYSDNDAQYKRPVESVLQQDKTITKSVESDSLLAMIKTIVQRMHEIDLSKCPEDFRYAYQRHIDAWSKAIPILRQGEDLNGFENILKSFAIGLIGGFTGQFGLVEDYISENAHANDEIKKKLQEVKQEINSTYSHLLQVAKKYKVDISPYSK